MKQLPVEVTYSYLKVYTVALTPKVTYSDPKVTYNYIPYI